MKLEIHSMKDDILELEIENIKEHKPQLYIGGLEVNDGWEPWHAAWQTLKISKFTEEFEAVKEKIINFYAVEGQRNFQTGSTTRTPGWGKLFIEHEEWIMQNLKIMNCKIRDDDKSIVLDLAFDGVNYKSKKPPEIID
jgi:hypothetical protein